MFKRISIILLGGALLLSACGPQGTPTMAPADVNNTAVAAAFTMVAQTQAAIPTNTAIPPTETPSPTPLPTFTLVPPPTLDQLLAPPTATQQASTGTCDQVLNVGEAGALKRVRLENETNATANVALTLTTPNAFGQCGYLTGFNNVVKKGEKRIVSIPVGTWYIYAWLTNKDGSSGGTAGQSFTVNQGYDDLISIKIKGDIISVQ